MSLVDINYTNVQTKLCNFLIILHALQENLEDDLQYNHCLFPHSLLSASLGRQMGLSKSALDNCIF